MQVFIPNGASSTAVLDAIEMQPITTEHLASQSAPSPKAPPNDHTTPQANDDVPTTDAVDTQEVWNHPRSNLLRVLATFWSFAILGMNDASYGAIIPYLELYYNEEYTIIALVFLSPFVGYNAAALLNTSLHMRFGQRGVAFAGPACHVISYIIVCLAPPYPVLVLAFILSGLGNGFLDAGWNAWIGAMPNANELLGFLHGFYGLGATVAPLIATAMITKAGLPWNTWYYCMVGFAATELVTCVAAFWPRNGAVYRDQHPRPPAEHGSRLKEATLRPPAARVTWLASVFLLGYVGAEVALGGWIVAFMIQVRDGGRFASGMTATGFWLGITVGRLVLGFVTPKLGEKLAIAIYLPIATSLHLLFWLVPSFLLSAISIAIVGFFLGPLFPAAMVVCTKLLPKHLHIPGIGFAAAFGGSGGAIFPYAVGAIAQARGVQVLQPIVLALLVAIWMLWLALPRVPRARKRE